MLSVRWKIAVAVAASYALAIAPWLLLGWPGLWWAKLVLVVSWPLAVIGCATSFFFAQSVIQNPLRWALLAVCVSVALSILALYLTTRTWVGVIAVLFAAPSAAIFYGFVRTWLRQDGAPR